MMKVFEKSGLTINAKLEDGIYSLTILFDRNGTRQENDPI
jgi:hypothetical protein